MAAEIFPTPHQPAGADRAGRIWADLVAAAGESVAAVATHGLLLGVAGAGHLGQAAQPGLHRLVYGARDAQPGRRPTWSTRPLVPATPEPVDTSAGHVLLPAGTAEPPPDTQPGDRLADGQPLFPTRGARGWSPYPSQRATPCSASPTNSAIKPETVLWQLFV